MNPSSLMRRRFVLLTIALTLGCATAADMPVVSPGDSMRLAMTDAVRVEPPGIVVQFAAVVADSRCPRDVTCVWAGDAEIALRVSSDDGGAADLRLHTNVEPRSATFEGVRFTLAELEPLPAAGSTPRQAEYVATVEIE
ncbi:MAG: hypothetical protein ACRD2J_05340 [Thermoanaerobaculia bacterium]